MHTMWTHSEEAEVTPKTTLQCRTRAIQRLRGRRVMPRSRRAMPVLPSLSLASRLPMADRKGENLSLRRRLARAMQVLQERQHTSILITILLVSTTARCGRRASEPILEGARLRRSIYDNAGS